MALDRILVMDDEAVIRNTLAEMLRRKRYHVSTASTIAEAESLLNRDSFDLAFMDVCLPDGNGTELLERMMHDPALAHPLVVMITANATVELAVKSMKLGAFDFLVKPFSGDQIAVLLKKAASFNRLVSVNRYLSNESDEGSELIGNSESMMQLKKMVGKVAATEATVLITGENGTGKEMVARELYRLSPRRNEPYIRVNCAAIPDSLIESEFFGHEKGAFTGATQRREGRFELADKGTILLDEIGEISQNAQVKLLRVLQEREFERVGGTRTISVNVRVIASTNRDLLRAVEQGNFREDLYYRLNIFPLQMPPLRERLDDVPLLANHFLRNLCRKHGLSSPGFTPDAMEMMQGYDWPGNVRELQNVIERSVILTNQGENVSAENLALATPQRTPRVRVPTIYGIEPEAEEESQPEQEETRPTAAASMPGTNGHDMMKLEDLERSHILGALARLGGNRKAVSEQLDISPRTLRAKLQQYREAGYTIPASQRSAGE